MPTPPMQPAARAQRDGSGPPAWTARFAVERTLADQAGVMAVYAGRDTRDQASVVIRVIPWIADGTIQARAFEDGVSVRRRLDHPGIAPVVDAGIGPYGAWIATSPGDETLDALLARGGPLAPEDAIVLLAPVAAALDVAHARGLVCDALTPAEVWITRDAAGRPRGELADIGPAWPTTLRPGRLLGDVDQLAPEEIRGETPSPRSNTYALGALLVRCLTGEPPFPATSRAAALSAHLETSPPRVSERVDRELPGLDRVVASALAKDPAERPASATALLAAAADALGVEGSAATVDPPEPPPPATALPVTQEPPRNPDRGRGRLLVLLLLLAPAAVLIALAAYLVVHSGAPRAQPTQRSPVPTVQRAATAVESVTLHPPGAQPGGDGPTGAVRVVQRDGSYVLTIAGARLPPESTDPVEAYTVWLVGPGRAALRLGAVVPAVGRTGRFVNHRELPRGANRYRRLIVTREVSLEARPVGPTVLEAQVRLPAVP
jgi:hypothetical protein